MSEPSPALDDPFKDITPFSIHNLPRLEKYNKPNKGRHYKLPSRIEVPSVTNVLGLLDKPALLWWAASVERDMIIKYAKLAYRTNPTSYEEFENILLDMIPRQQARFKKSKEATDIGQETHDLIQHRCKEMLGQDDTEGEAQDAGTPPEDGTEEEQDAFNEPDPRPKVSDAAELAFMAWEEWAQGVNFEPLLVEQTVWSDIMKAAGTVDCGGIQDWPEPGERRHFAYDWKSSKRSKTAPNGIYPESLIQVCTYAEMLVELGIFPENTMGCIVRLPKSLEDHIFEEAGQGAVDHVEIMPETRIKIAEGFHNIRKTWTFMKEEMG